MARMVSWIVAGVAALFVAAPASASLIQVDWEAEPPSALQLAGTISGSLGVFDVATPGQSFVLPTDGSLTAVTAGWADFPNRTWSFIGQRDPSDEPLTIVFVSLDPIVIDLQGPGTVSGIITEAVDCTFGGDCLLWINPADRINPATVTPPGLARVITTTAAQSRDMVFSTTVVPEPGTALLLGLGCAALASRRERRQA